MFKTNRKIVITSFVFLLVFMFSSPLVLAAVDAAQISDSSPRPSTGLVPCGNTVDKDGKVKDACELGDLFTLINNLMNYGLWLVTLVLVGVIAYAGFKYITSRGNPAEVKKANHMFWLMIQGLIWMLCAWLLVYTISNTFLKSGYDTFLTK